MRRLAPEQRGFRPGGLSSLDDIVAAAVRDGAFPGAVVAVGRDDALVHLRAFGRLALDPGAAAAAEDTIYDLASLTKVVATTAMAMILVDQGRLDIDWPVSRLIPEFSGGAKDGVAIRQLLSHSSGIHAWLPLYRELSGREAFIERIAREALAYEPGTQSVYSDPGFILLGVALERVAGASLDAFVSEHVLQPLGMGDTSYRPAAALRPRIAPTEDDPWRGRVVHGEVHDENAFAMGGVAGHAGLFGTAADLSRFALMVLSGGEWEGRRLIARATLDAFASAPGVAGGTHALGWDRPSPERSAAGRLFSRRSIGHLGYAGTSIWIDLERRLFLILLTNRVHPTRRNEAIKQVRPAVADAAIGGLAG